MSSQLKVPPDGNQNRTGTMVGMIVGSVIIAGIFVVLRMYTRLYLTKSARWDDWTIVLAFVSSAVGLVLDILGIHNGYGRHEYYLTDHQIQEFMKLGYGDWIQTFWTLAITKVSICLLLLRISPSKRIVWPIRSLIFVLILSNIIVCLLWILQCIPLDAAWNAEKKKAAKCFTQGQLQRIIMTHSIISIISDFILAGFPIIILQSVQIKLRQKILLCGLMGLGLLTAACCIARTIMNWQNIHADQTWVSFDNYMWRTAEVDIGIIAACIPTLLPLYRLIRDKFSIAGQNSSLNISRFTKLLFGQTSETNTIARKPLWRYHKRDPSSALQQGERKDSTSHPFTQIERDGYEDMEMKVGILGHE